MRDFHPAMRPFACLVVAVLATSSAPVFAQSTPSTPPAAPHSQTPASSAAPSAPQETAPAPKDDGAGLRTAGYIAAGVGIAGFILFAVAGLGAKNAHDRLDAACGTTQCNDGSHDSDIADGKLLQTAANIGLATGLTGFGLGATLFVLGSHSSNDAVPTVGAAPGGMITFRGRF